MRYSLFLLALAAAIAMLALPALAEEEEEAIADYLAYYEQMGVSDSLLT